MSEKGKAKAAAQEDAATEVDKDPGQEQEAKEEELSPLATAERERDQYLDLAQRTQAELENYRKRTVREIEVAEERAINKVIRDLLPVLDNLERALAAAEPRDQEKPENPLSEGVRLVYEELSGILKRLGIEHFDPTGDKFDPNQHEAVTTRSENGVEAGTVVEVLQKGYQRQDSVLRPASVVVAEADRTNE